jgi:hypothetical protein
VSVSPSPCISFWRRPKGLTTVIKASSLSPLPPSLMLLMYSHKIPFHSFGHIFNESGAADGTIPGWEHALPGNPEPCLLLILQHYPNIPSHTHNTPSPCSSKLDGEDELLFFLSGKPSFHFHITPLIPLLIPQTFANHYLYFLISTLLLIFYPISWKNIFLLGSKWEYIFTLSQRGRKSTAAP